MKKVKFKLSSFILVVIVLSSFVTIAFAAGSLLPDQIMQMLGLLGPGGICASAYIQSRVQTVIILALGGVVLVAVAYALMAAFTYIRSQGESGEMEKAQKSIKAIFIGIAAMIIAIVGIVLVFAIFGARQQNPELLQTCINAPLSLACKDCNEGKDKGLCNACENAITNYCNGNPSDAGDWESIKASNSEIRNNCK